MIATNCGRGCGLRHAVIVGWVKGTAEYEPFVALAMVSMAVRVLYEMRVVFIPGLDARPTLVVTWSVYVVSFVVRLAWMIWCGHRCGR